MRYDAEWKGFDRGREGLFVEPFWSDVLAVLAAHEGEDFHDETASLHAHLIDRFPETKWIGDDAAFRPFLRDYPQAWTLTGVLEPRTSAHPTIRVTPLGHALLSGAVSRHAVFAQAMTRLEEKRVDGTLEHPFRVLAAAFLQSAIPPMSLSQIFHCVQQGWRPGDGPLAAVLKPDSSLGDVPDVRRRRLRMMLLNLEEVGAIHREGDQWRPELRPILESIFGGAELSAADLAAATSSVDAAEDGEMDAATDAVESEMAQIEEALGENAAGELRERVMRAIAVRRGQPRFRSRLLRLYRGACAITGYDAVEALEAAHIVPYASAGSHSPRNGLLLRADLHTLFDLHLVSVNPSTMRTALSPRIASTRYASYRDEPIRLPLSVADRPDVGILGQHFAKLKS